jgi:DNA repair exonuclease SbcCD ATPase subunit
MLITRIQARNIGAIKDIDLDLTALGDIVAIVGSNGAGKTWLLECVLLGLYRRCSRGSLASSVDGSGELLIDFERDGVAYCAHHIISEEGQQAFLRSGDQSTSGKVRDFDNAIALLLPPYHVFVASAFAPQGGTEFGALSVAQRRELLEVLCGIEQYRLWHTHVKGLRRDTEVRIEGISLQGLLEDPLSIEQQLQHAQTRLEEIRDQLVVRDTTIAKLAQREEELRSVQQQIEALEQSIVTIRQRHETQVQALRDGNRQTQIAALKASIAEADQEMQTTAQRQQKLLESQDRYNQHMQQHKELEARIGSLTQVAGPADVPCSMSYQDRCPLLLAIDDTRQQLAEARHQLQALATIPDPSHELQDTARQITRLQKLLQEQHADLSSESSRQQAYELTWQKGEDYDARISRAQERIIELRASIQGLGVDIKDLRCKLDSLPAPHDLQHGTQRASELQALLAGHTLALKNQATRNELIADHACLKVVERSLAPDGIPALLIDAIGPQLSERCNQLLSSTCFRVDLQTTRTTKKGAVAETIELMVHDSRSNQSRPVSALSGGERVLIHQALRLAISAYNQRALGINQLWLDEPAGALDAYNRDEYIDMIRAGITTNNINQIIMITHEEAYKQRSDSVIIIEQGRANEEG